MKTRYSTLLRKIVVTSITAFFMSVPAVMAATHSQDSQTQSSGSQHHKQMGQDWQKQAAETFYLSPEMSSKLMSQQQWKDHEQQMAKMNTQEREQYRTEWHRKLMEQARQQGMNIPDVPAGHGKMGHEAAGVILATAQDLSGGFGSSTGTGTMNRGSFSSGNLGQGTLNNGSGSFGRSGLDNSPSSLRSRSVTPGTTLSEPGVAGSNLDMGSFGPGERTLYNNSDLGATSTID